MSNDTSLSAGAQAPRSAAPSPAPNGVPNRWWQWLLIYPALAISVLTAAPKWVDGALAAANNIGDRSYADAKLQSELWAKNLPCAAEPSNYVPTKSNLKIDATVCDSGDIFVRAATADDAQPQYFWLPLNKILGKDGSPRSLFSSAAAAEPDGAWRRNDGGLLQKVQNTLCQKFVDSRHIVRRVRTPKGCSDLTVDTFTGRVISTRAVACVAKC